MDSHSSSSVSGTTTRLRSTEAVSIALDALEADITLPRVACRSEGAPAGESMEKKLTALRACPSWAAAPLGVQRHAFGEAAGAAARWDAVRAQHANDVVETFARQERWREARLSGGRPPSGGGRRVGAPGSAPSTPAPARRYPGGPCVVTPTRAGSSGAARTASAMAPIASLALGTSSKSTTSRRRRCAPRRRSATKTPPGSGSDVRAFGGTVLAPAVYLASRRVHRQG